MTAAVTTRRTGRPCNEDVEERRAIGRLVHSVEGYAYGAAAELTYARESVAEYPTHDAGEDAAVETMELLGWLLQCRDLSRDEVRLIGRAIVTACGQYRYHDGHSDRAVTQTGYRVSLAHVEVKGITGACELAVTGRSRGRSVPRPTSAVQGTLLDEVE